MRSHQISRALFPEQATYVQNLLKHPCFQYDQVQLRAVRLKSGCLRLTLETPWEYPKTFQINHDNAGHNRIVFQLQIYEEYSKASKTKLPSYGRSTTNRALRGPVELRQIAVKYGSEINRYIDENSGKRDKIRTEDKRLIVGLKDTRLILPQISYLRYEQEEFSIVYSDGKTRIELGSVLSESVIAGLAGKTTFSIMGEGFGRDVQRILSVSAKKSRTIIVVETILCLMSPPTNPR